MQMKYSLRSFFALLTIATLILGYRYNERRTLQDTATRIQGLGGTVFYAWQNPRVVNVPTWQDPYAENEPNTVLHAKSTINVPYNISLADGSIVTKTRTETAHTHMNTPVQVMLHEYRAENSSPPTFSIISFLLGSHEDVSVVAVSIPLDSIDQDTLKSLSQLDRLNNVILCVDQWYFRVEASSRLDSKERNNRLAPFKERLNWAAEQIEARIPAARVHSRGMTRNAG